jgi:hypothetical protein
MRDDTLKYWLPMRRKLSSMSKSCPTKRYAHTQEYNNACVFPKQTVLSSWLHSVYFSNSVQLSRVISDTLEPDFVIQHNMASLYATWFYKEKTQGTCESEPCKTVSGHHPWTNTTAAHPLLQHCTTAQRTILHHGLLAALPSSPGCLQLEYTLSLRERRNDPCVPTESAKWSVRSLSKILGSLATLPSMDPQIGKCAATNHKHWIGQLYTDGDTHVHVDTTTHRITGKVSILSKGLISNQQLGMRKTQHNRQHIFLFHKPARK